MILTHWSTIKEKFLLVGNFSFLWVTGTIVWKIQTVRILIFLQNYTSYLFLSLFDSKKKITILLILIIIIIISEEGITFPEISEKYRENVYYG